MPTAMVQNLCALTGFLLLLWADFIATRRKTRGIRPIKTAGYSLVGLSFILLVVLPSPLSAELPPMDMILLLSGIAIAAGSFYLLVKTVFLEFPGERKKSGTPSDTLVKSGSYGLCRHPGFWWFSLLALDLAALRGFGGFLGSAILLIVLNFVLILVQDVYLFPKIFDGYDDYRKSVPFLFPRKRTTRCGGK